MDIDLENRDKIIALLREGTCPICNRKRLASPLAHIAKTHGIPHKEFKDAIGIALKYGFASSELSKIRHESALRNEMAARINATIRPTPDARQSKQIKKVARVAPDGTTTEYRSISEAARKNGVSFSAVSNCLRGISKTCAGYEWIYRQE
jgi:hypothetical protein